MQGKPLDRQALCYPTAGRRGVARPPCLSPESHLRFHACKVGPRKQAPETLSTPEEEISREAVCALGGGRLTSPAPCPPPSPASHIVGLAGQASVLHGRPEQRRFSLLNFQKENVVSTVSTDEADRGLGAHDPARLFLGPCSGLGQGPHDCSQGLLPLPSSLTGDRSWAPVVFPALKVCNES